MTWTNDDAVAAREFFSKATGQKILEDMRDQEDAALSETGNFEAEALSAREAKGRKKARQRIEELMFFNEKPQVTSEYVDVSQ